MVKLKFYGGINQIGGNKILLEDQGTKIFLDFGMNFNDHNKYFTEYMPPRKCNCITDLIHLGLLPDIKGLYREDYTEHMGYKDQKENTADGVLVSHAHIDHIGYIHFLRKNIPIHVSPETKAVMELFTKIGSSGFEEFTEIKPSFELIPKKRSEGTKRRDSREGTEKRKIQLFNFGKKFKIKNLEILPLRVDHSLPGATGFIIYTSKGPIIYTGDLRFHGRHQDWSYDFTEEASKTKPVAIITEGTRIKETDSKTEEYVQKQSTKKIRNNKGLVIVNFPIRDTDRLLTFYNTAIENNRKLILEYRQAMLLDILKENGVKNLPDSNDKNIKIFYPKKSWGLIGREDFPEEQIQKDYQRWEKKYLKNKNIITAEQIKQKQNKYVMFMNYFQLNNLFDIRPKTGSIMIRSICEPFNDDMELDQERVDHWLKLFSLYPEIKIHSSGHGCGPDLINMIKKINPKKIFPIHTEHPDLFKKIKINMELVKEGKTYKL